MSTAKSPKAQNAAGSAVAKPLPPNVTLSHIPRLTKLPGMDACADCGEPVPSLFRCWPCYWKHEWRSKRANDGIEVRGHKLRRPAAPAAPEDPWVCDFCGGLAKLGDPINVGCRAVREYLASVGRSVPAVPAPAGSKISGCKAEAAGSPAAGSGSPEASNAGWCECTGRRHVRHSPYCRM